MFQRVRADHSRLDVLVNNVYGTPSWNFEGNVPFWDLPLAYWDVLEKSGLVVGPNGGRALVHTAVGRYFTVVEDCSSAAKLRAAGKS